MLSVDVRSTKIAYLNHFILGLGMYFTPVNGLSKQNHAMCHRMRKPQKLKQRCYDARIIHINEYLAAFPGEKTRKKSAKRNLMRLF